VNQTYKISINKKALKFIMNQDLRQRKRIMAAIYKLPFGDVIKMKGNEFYRLRTGNIRLIFTKDDIELVILIIDIGNRGQIYEGL
jgi:mRNA interferase RelE/StbE